jgi:hypothetical protein
VVRAEPKKGKRPEGVAKRPAFEERVSWVFGQRYSWRCYRRRKTFLSHCSYKDKDLAATLETLGSMLAQHCRANQRELFMVTVLFYREETVEGSFRRSFELLEKLQSWLLAEGGDFFLSTVELHRVLPENSAEGSVADDGFDDLSDGGEYPEEEVGVAAQPETGALVVGQGRKRRAVGR